MKVTDPRNFGDKVAQQASIDSSIRSAYAWRERSGVALAQGVEEIAKTGRALQEAEEDAKQRELYSRYQLEVKERTAQLDEEHRQTNMPAEEWQKRHDQMLDEVHGKYSNIYEFQTPFGKQYQTKIDLAKQDQRISVIDHVNDIAMQNQSISWARSEQVARDAAVSGGYQMLQAMHSDMSEIFDSPQYLVAFGDRAIVNKQKFIDETSELWVSKKLLGGSNPREMLASIQSGNMMQSASETAKLRMVVDINQEMKRQQAEAEKIAKAAAEQSQIAMAAQNIALTGVINPDDKLQVKAFEMGLSRIDQTAENPLQAQQLKMQTRVSVGYIEPKEAGRLNAQLLSMDPAKAQMALQETEYYLQNNPAMARHFDKYKGLMYVTNLTAGGVDIATAVDMYKQSVAIPEDQQKQYRKEARTDEVLTPSIENIVSKVTDAFDGDSTLGFGGWNEENGEKVADRAKRLFADFYVQYQGNAEAAERAVVQQIAKSHGVTQIGGDDLFMYKAPSTFMPMQGKPGQEAPQIKAVFSEDMTGAGIPAEVIEGSRLAYTGKKSKAGNPVYSITYQNEPVRKDGRVIEWEFDPKIVQQRAQEAEIQELQNKRDEVMNVIQGKVSELDKRRAHIVKQLTRLKAERANSGKPDKVLDRLIQKQEQKLQEHDQQYGAAPIGGA